MCRKVLGAPTEADVGSVGVLVFCGDWYLLLIDW